MSRGVGRRLLAPGAVVALLLSSTAVFGEWQRDATAIAWRQGTDVVWRFSFDAKAGKPFFDPLRVGGSSLTSFRPEDHPWHYGLWLSWKYVNGVNYWEEDRVSGRAEGATRWTPPTIDARPDGGATISLDLSYVHPSGRVDMSEHRELRVSAPGADGGYWIDWYSRFVAGKEGALLDRTPMPGEPDGKVNGGYAGLGIRLAGVPLVMSCVTPDGPVSSWESDRARPAAPAVACNFADGGMEIGGLAIFSDRANAGEAAPWYLIKNDVMRFACAAVLAPKPVQLAAGAEWTLRYRIELRPRPWTPQALRLSAALPAAAAPAYATNRYRNLFVEAGRTPREVEAKIAAAYEQLFHGDLETERLYFPSGENENGPLAYIPDIQHQDVRSEGMSYGMMIAVQLDKKAEFDALWNWSMTHMYHADPRHPSYGYFSWQLAYDGTVMDELPAPDGEEYYVMALYFAANRWGSGKGIYDYKAQADRLLDHMVHRAPITGMVRQRGGPREHTVGKEVSDRHAMILFSPDERNGMTDASYHLPAFYELWARWGPERDRAFWARAADVSRDYFVKNTHPKTGLASNLGAFDGAPLGFRGPASAEFREDAWRVAMNWSVDWSWWAKDPRQQQLSDRIQAFFESQGLDGYGDNWKLDGTPVRPRHSPGLVATNGVASLAATDAARSRRFVDALWNLEVPKSQVFRYYDGLLYMMSLMHAAGRFRIIMPPAAERPAGH